MKRTLLLILSVMAFAGISVAQDVYSTGYYYNHDNNKKVAAVYKNNELLFSTGNDFYYHHESSDVLLLDDDVFWVDNYIDSDNDYYYSRVMKNNDVFLEIPIGTKCHINCLFTDGMNVYAGGDMIVNSHRKPMVWKNTDPTPYLTFDAINYNYGYLYDAMIVDGLVIACGYVYDYNTFENKGVIWQENQGEMYILEGYVIPLSMDYYNGSVYTATWDVDDDIGAVYQNDYVLYTITTNGSVPAISVDAGDVFAGVFNNGGSIWKNGEKLYDTPYGNYTECVVANSEGVYYATDGRINKNDLALYSFELDNTPIINSIFVDLECQNNDIRTLPYYENFETGATDWACWGQLDIDHANNGYASYWHRGGDNAEVSAYGGHYCAWHRYNGVYDQNGLLATPLISIPADGNTTMTFKTYEQYPGDYGYEGVWVIEGGHKASVEVWTQTEPSAEWKTVSIDLSAYQGKNVQIDFRYQGQNGHSWYIDDVTIVSDYQPCPPVSAPYVERFDTGLGDCMYVMDVDHDGVCWKWDSSIKAAVHTFGSLHNQGGALLTPSIILSSEKTYQLKYDIYTSLPKGEAQDAVEYSVWMAVDNTGLGNLDEFNEIWRRTPTGNSTEPETVTLDLAPYSGHTIQLAFVYEGNGIYTWLLDNIEVAEKTGVGETADESLAVYPNPARESIRIPGLETESEVQIYNSLGELVKTANVNANQEIGIGELASGLYLVRCGNATMRFVKE